MAEEFDCVYGFPCVENPHDFTPDAECCTPEEIACWEQAKKDWDAGTYKGRAHCESKYDDKGNLVMHISRTSWGIGINDFHAAR